MPRTFISCRRNDSAPNTGRIYDRLEGRFGQAQVLRERIQQDLARLAQEDSITRVNLTDQDAQLMKGRQGVMPGYDAQAMASPVAESSGSGRS